jgi:hypothetical protein
MKRSSSSSGNTPEFLTVIDSNNSDQFKLEFTENYSELLNTLKTELEIDDHKALKLTYFDAQNEEYVIKNESRYKIFIRELQQNNALKLHVGRSTLEPKNIPVSISNSISPVDQELLSLFDPIAQEKKEDSKATPEALSPPNSNQSLALEQQDQRASLLTPLPNPNTKHGIILIDWQCFKDTICSMQKKSTSSPNQLTYFLAGIINHMHELGCSKIKQIIILYQGRLPIDHNLLFEKLSLDTIEIETIENGTKQQLRLLEDSETKMLNLIRVRTDEHILIVSSRPTLFVPLMSQWHRNHLQIQLSLLHDLRQNEKYHDVDTIDPDLYLINQIAQCNPSQFNLYDNKLPQWVSICAVYAIPELQELFKDHISLSIGGDESVRNSQPLTLKWLSQMHEELEHARKFRIECKEGKHSTLYKPCGFVTDVSYFTIYIDWQNVHVQTEYIEGFLNGIDDFIKGIPNQAQQNKIAIRNTIVYLSEQHQNKAAAVFKKFKTDICDISLFTKSNGVDFKILEDIQRQLDEAEQKKEKMGLVLVSGDSDYLGTLMRAVYNSHRIFLIHNHSTWVSMKQNPAFEKIINYSDLNHLQKLKNKQLEMRALKIEQLELKQKHLLNLFLSTIDLKHTGEFNYTTFDALCFDSFTSSILLYSVNQKHICSLGFPFTNNRPKHIIPYLKEIIEKKVIQFSTFCIDPFNSNKRNSLYLGDETNRQIYRIDRRLEGMSQDQYPVIKILPEDNKSPSIRPKFLCFDNQERLWIIDEESYGIFCLDLKNDPVILERIATSLSSGRNPSRVCLSGSVDEVDIGEPSGLCLNQDDDMIFCDRRYGTVRQLKQDENKKWYINTLVGGPEAPLGHQLHQPSGICCDTEGTLFVTDSATNTVKRIVKKIESVSVNDTEQSGYIVSLAIGANNAGKSDGDMSQGKLNNPGVMTIDTNNIIYLLDMENSSLRAIMPNYNSQQKQQHFSLKKQVCRSFLEGNCEFQNEPHQCKFSHIVQKDRTIKNDQCPSHLITTPINTPDSNFNEKKESLLAPVIERQSANPNTINSLISPQTQKKYYGLKLNFTRNTMDKIKSSTDNHARLKKQIKDVFTNYGQVAEVGFYLNDQKGFGFVNFDSSKALITAYNRLKNEPVQNIIDGALFNASEPEKKYFPTDVTIHQQSVINQVESPPLNMTGSEMPYLSAANYNETFFNRPAYPHQQNFAGANLYSNVIQPYAQTFPSYSSNISTFSINNLSAQPNFLVHPLTPNNYCVPYAANFARNSNLMPHQNTPMPSYPNQTRPHFSKPTATSPELPIKTSPHSARFFDISPNTQTNAASPQQISDNKDNRIITTRHDECDGRRACYLLYGKEENIDALIHSNRERAKAVNGIELEPDSSTTPLCGKATVLDFFIFYLKAKHTPTADSNSVRLPIDVKNCNTRRYTPYMNPRDWPFLLNTSIVFDEFFKQFPELKAYMEQDDALTKYFDLPLIDKTQKEDILKTSQNELELIEKARKAADDNPNHPYNQLSSMRTFLVFRIWGSGKKRDFCLPFTHCDWNKVLNEETDKPLEHSEVTPHRAIRDIFQYDFSSALPLPRGYVYCCLCKTTECQCTPLSQPLFQNIDPTKKNNKQPLNFFMHYVEATTQLIQFIQLKPQNNLKLEQNIALAEWQANALAGKQKIDNKDSLPSTMPSQSSKPLHNYSLWKAINQQVDNMTPTTDNLLEHKQQ